MFSENLMRSLLAHRSLAAVSMGMVALVPFAATLAPSGAAVPTCEGQRPTVTPTADGSYSGTSGPDVIVVSTPDARVYAGAGDDLICVDRAAKTRVDAGEGDDGVFVRDESSYKGMWVMSLGKGDDTFVGGPGSDRVTGAFDDIARYDQGHDQIVTHGGRDFVTVSSEGYAAHHVDLDLGDGDDAVDTYGDGVTSDSTLIGGEGQDLLGLLPEDSARLDILFDAGSRTIDRGGRIVSSWDVFERYRINDSGGGTVRFEGTVSPESLRIVAAEADVSMGGGRDVVELSAADGIVRGGAGRDAIIGSNEGMHIDLAQQEFVSGGNRVALESFQDATSYSYSGKVTGSWQDNTIVVGCGTVRGGRGDDRIREFTPIYLRFPHPDSCTDFLAYGGPGDDILSGSHGPDRLVGGSGRDTAFGKRGLDVCRVERAFNC